MTEDAVTRAVAKRGAGGVPAGQGGGVAERGQSAVKFQEQATSLRGRSRAADRRDRGTAEALEEGNGSRGASRAALRPGRSVMSAPSRSPAAAMCQSVLLTHALAARLTVMTLRTLRFDTKPRATCRGSSSAWSGAGAGIAGLPRYATSRSRATEAAELLLTSLGGLAVL